MSLDIVYIFDDAESRVRGLSGKSIDVGECAMFLYSRATSPSYWMKDVPVDLYVSAIVGYECVESHFMKAMSTDPHKFSVFAHVFVESRAEIPVGSHVSIRGSVLEIG